MRRVNIRHDKIIRALVNQIRAFYVAKTPFRVYHGSTNSTRILTFERSRMLDVSRLNHILSIDTKHHTAIVEPNMPMDALLKATLQKGLLPPVITEFPGITVGGGIQGGAGESSSFKYGFFSQNINWQEMILTDGSIIKASPESHADLFYGSAGSMGTFGVMTAAEIRLIPAKRYVRITYHPVTSFEAANQAMRKYADEKIDFLDGIMFSKTSGVIITGVLSDTKSTKYSRFSRAHDEWFYLHAAAISQQGSEYTESTPLRDYLFRYDRGAFWVGRFAFERFNVPYTRLTRWLLDPLLHTRKLYQALQDSGASQEHIVQDLTLPFDTAPAFMEYLDRDFGIYPLWLCPILPASRSPLLCNSLDTDLAINIGVWGPRVTDYAEFMAANRAIELKLLAMNGKKWLYAHTYYSEAEFWQIYDKKWYDDLRTKYMAGSLPNVYDKTRVHETHQVNAKRGLLKTVFGRAKLKIKN